MIQGQLDELPQQIDSYTYCDAECALGEAQTLLAGDPSSLQLLTADNIPTNFKVKPTDATQSDALSLLRDSLRDLPNVGEIILAQDYLDIIGKLQGFAGLYTVILSVTLLIAAVLLIWNTIRTAMFARRREIEVMKLVGATDWFIRLPFMLEGLIQGFIGGLAACGGLWLINDRWTAGVSDFPPEERLRPARRVGRLPHRPDADPARHRHGRRRDRRRHRGQPLPGRLTARPVTRSWRRWRALRPTPAEVPLARPGSCGRGNRLPLRRLRVVLSAS